MVTCGGGKRAPRAIGASDMLFAIQSSALEGQSGDLRGCLTAGGNGVTAFKLGRRRQGVREVDVYPNIGYIY